MPQENTSKDVISRTDSNKIPSKQEPTNGNNYLFVIAIDAYQNCPTLYNCVRDAKGLIAVLTEKYHFQPAHIRTLFDQEATERNIFSTFRELAKTITPADNLVIFFSGHGEYDKVFGEGYWIPIDAKEGAQEDYIANGKIKTFLNAIPSLHTFLIVDSCFSGSLFTNFKSTTLAERLSTEPSRWGLTAGRNEIVADGQAGTNSPFAEMLLYQLRNTTKPIGVAALCNKVVETVIANANQTPRGEPLKINGHRGGQFFFWPKGYEGSLREDSPSIYNESSSTKSTTGTMPLPSKASTFQLNKIPKCSIYVSVTLMALIGIFFFNYANFFSTNKEDTTASLELPPEEVRLPPPVAIENPPPIITTAPPPVKKDIPVVVKPAKEKIQPPPIVETKKEEEEEEKLEPLPIVLQKASKGGKYGFKDTNSGVWIVPPQYKLVTAFSGGLAAVQDFNYKWGYMNEQGKLVIPHVIDQPTKFGTKKRVKVMINAEWVTINKMGKVQVGNRIMDLEDYLKNE